MSEMSYKWDASKYKSSSKLQADIGTVLLEYVNVSEGDYILDAGCGIGNFSIELASKAKDVHVIGIDLSDSMIEKCNELIAKTDADNVEFINMSLTDIPYKNKFNIIFSNSVLHWVNNIKEALDALVKALKTGGNMAMQFPLINSEHPLMYFTSKVIKELELSDYYEEWSNPWYVPTQEEFESLLKDEGLNDVSVSKKKSCFKFNSVKDAYNFLDAVGLNLFLETLPEDKKDLFIKKLYTDLQGISINGKLELNFERIFAFAAKKSR